MDFQIPEWVVGATALWVYSAIIQALPDPDSESSKAYRFVFQFLHALGANTNLVKKTSERAASFASDKEKPIALLRQRDTERTDQRDKP